jgi:3-oxoacyl-[acyl-carrier protein] reductase
MGSGHLEGRVAIVTGAGRNIGRAIALGLAEDGAAVVVNVRANRSEAEEVVAAITTRGGVAMVALADVADPAAVGRMIEEVVRRFGRIDILVNNAALRREKAFAAMTLVDWREVMAATLDSVFICTKAALPYLQSAGAGRIVNIGGVSANTGAKHRAHVITAKTGLIGFTRALAHDLAGDAITVNCVSPGMMETARDPAHTLPSHHRSDKTLTGRFGTPEELAAAVRYLCGPGSGHVTGQTLHVNGGAFLGS